MNVYLRDWPVQADTLPALRPGEVHVWRADLDVDAARWQALWRLLSGEERVQMQRLLDARIRRRRAACRGILRSLLAGYTGGDAAKLVLRAGAQGKPELPGNSLYFNVAHSQQWALLAIAAGRRVGVDVEVLHPVPEVDTIAALCFAPQEWQDMAHPAGEERLRRFFDLWVCKEAVLKAIGSGFARPPDQLVVSAETSQVVGCTWDPDETRRWQLAVFGWPGVRAALAIERTVETNPVAGGATRSASGSGCECGPERRTARPDRPAGR